LSGVSTAYLWDGYNAATTSGTLNLSGVGLDDSYAQVASGGTSSNLSDGNGNTVALTSTSAAITTHYTYSPYGETTKAGTADTPSQFTGRENDGSSNLYYYRSRYYMPRLGRFVSEDPSRFFGGLNLYTYVGNDPLDRTDPSGNCPSCLIGALVEVGFEAYTGELNNAFSQAFEGNFGALAVSAGKIGVASLSGGVSTVAAAKAVSIVGKAYEAANIGRVATAVAKVETVAAVQAASGAASKVATNAVEGKPLGEGVGTAATVGAVVGTAGKYGGDAISKCGGQCARRSRVSRRRECESGSRRRYQGSDR
jgi:RHS repeat-associated protein